MGFGQGFGSGFGTGFSRAGGGGPDTIPDDFPLGQRTNMPASTAIPSAPFYVSGIEAASPWSITVPGDISINDGPYESAGGNLNNGDKVIVRLTSSATPGASVSTTLTIGGVNGVYTLTTANASVVTPFPQKGGGVCPPRDASPMEWAAFLARQKNRARRIAAQG
jgi:hypothetical protein